MIPNSNIRVENKLFLSVHIESCPDETCPVYVVFLTLPQGDSVSSPQLLNWQELEVLQGVSRLLPVLCHCTGGGGVLGIRQVLCKPQEQRPVAQSTVLLSTAWLGASQYVEAVPVPAGDRW